MAIRDYTSNEILTLRLQALSGEIGPEEVITDLLDTVEDLSAARDYDYASAEKQADKIGKLREEITGLEMQLTAWRQELIDAGQRLLDTAAELPEG